MTAQRKVMEARRQVAESLLADGIRPAQIARDLGVARISVYRWQQRLGQHPQQTRRTRSGMREALSV